jgi:hypothetical protein
MTGSAETLVVDPTAVATALVELSTGGTLHFAVAGQSGWIADVTGLHIHRGAVGVDGPIEVDLLAASGATFDPATRVAEGTFTISSALATEITTTPAAFYVNVHTTAAPSGLARAQLGLFAPVEWHAILRGGEETTPADPANRGAAALRVEADRSFDWVVAMKAPAVTSLVGAHVHAGGPGVAGSILIDFDIGSATIDAAVGTATDSTTVPLGTLARILGTLGGFYVNVHTAVNPDGAARGQLSADEVEMWSALRGDREVVPVDPSARGGVGLELRTFTSGNAILSVPPNQGMASVTGANVHFGASGVDGPAVIDLMAGADFVTSLPSFSSEGSIAYDQALYARMLANPGAFYVNFVTAAAPTGIVRGQLTQTPQTFHASMNGLQEVPPNDPTWAGDATVVFTAVHQCEFAFTIFDPPTIADMVGMHIHDAPVGVDGPILIDWLSGFYVVNGDTCVGSLTFSGRTFPRLLAAAPFFYVNFHNATFPGGAVRGQMEHLTADIAPSNLAYSDPSPVYQTASPIEPNVPSNTGGVPSLYTVSPGLPSGLGLNPLTGVISGTPTNVAASANYTVTASNDEGFTTAVVNITVVPGPPTSLTYTSPVTYIVGMGITPNIPSSTGGAITSYSVSPPLPPGLLLNGTTGVVSGTPGIASAAANFVVTGSNVSGSVQFTINITVNSSLTPPGTLTYSTNPATYFTGYAITSNTPTYSGGPPSTWAVTPALPAGLSFNTSTGVITGTPTAVTATATYVVTASNAAGNSTPLNLQITVNLGAPANLSYSPNPAIGYVGTPISNMNPSSTGGAVASYSISPSLPAGSGLSFNTTTGVVSGTPLSSMSSTNFTVTATNTTGSAQATITIIVY